jgi:hypothetical protein
MTNRRISGRRFILVNLKNVPSICIESRPARSLELLAVVSSGLSATEFPDFDIKWKRLGMIYKCLLTYDFAEKFA